MNIKHQYKKFMAYAWLALMFPAATLAGDPPPPPPSPQCQGAASVGAPCGSAGLSTGLDSVINIVFFIAGTAAVIAIIVGGMRYIFSGGDSGATKSAKDTILYALIGIVVIVLARAIVAFITGRL